MTSDNKDSQAPLQGIKTQVEVDQLFMRIKDVRDCNPLQATQLDYNLSIPKVLQVAIIIGHCGFKFLYDTPSSTTKHQQDIQKLFLSLYGQPSMKHVAHEESSLSTIITHSYITVEEQQSQN
jgi:hypothetical protein